jgi:hypothetical protein
VGGVPQCRAAQENAIEENWSAERPTVVPLHGSTSSDPGNWAAIPAAGAVSKRDTRRWSGQIHFLQVA